MARIKRVSRLSNQVAPAVTLDRDRRRERRGPVRRQAQVSILSGLSKGEVHEVISRDASTAGSAFFLKEQVPVGTKVKVVEIVDERPHRTFEGEITRVRPISNGRYEMNVRYDVRLDKPEIVKALAYAGDGLSDDAERRPVGSLGTCAAFECSLPLAAPRVVESRVFRRGLSL